MNNHVDMKDQSREDRLWHVMTTMREMIHREYDRFTELTQQHREDGQDLEALVCGRTAAPLKRILNSLEKQIEKQELESDFKITEVKTDSFPAGPPNERIREHESVGQRRSYYVCVGCDSGVIVDKNVIREYPIGSIAFIEDHCLNCRKNKP